MSHPIQACFEPVYGCNAHSAQRPCCKLASVHTQHLATGHRIQHMANAFPLHRPSAAIRRHQHSPDPLRHSQMLADSSRSLTNTDRSMADPAPRDSVSTLALLELLLAETLPSCDSSDSSVRLQSEENEPSQSHTEAAAGVKPEVDSSLSPPKPERSASTSTNISAGTSAQPPSAFTSTQTSSASTSAQTLRGTSTPTSSACTSAQTPRDIWALAWQPLEAGQAAQAQQAKHTQQANRSPSAVHAAAKSPGLSSLRFWRQQQGPNNDGHTDNQQEQQHTSGRQQGSRPPKPPLARPIAGPMRNAQMYLQGIEPTARLQLLALCLASIERQTLLLRKHNIRMSMREWLQLCPALLAVCSVQAGSSWLGCCPRELRNQARQVLSCLASGCSTVEESDSDSGLSSALSLLTQALPDQTTQHVTPTAHSPASSSSSPSSSSPFWRWSAGAESPRKKESSQAEPGNKDESSDTAVAESSSSTAWQSAAENAILHAMVLRHMCQQNRDTQSEPDEASSAVSCSYGDVGSPQASKHNTSQHHQQSLRDSARDRLTHTPSQASVQQSQESARQQREDAAMQQVLQAAPVILQDLAANVAEGVAVCYLAEARSGPSEAAEEAAPVWQQWSGLHLHPQLRSTRSLERFRNQVSLSRLLHDNLHAVAAVYEDRHLLCSFGPQAQLLQCSVKARRVRELEAMTGWKYAVSFMLEAADVVLPIFRSCMGRVSAAISWLLVKLIGRALGLIYRGVKQSLVPQRPKQKKQHMAESAPDALQSWVPKFT